MRYPKAPAILVLLASGGCAAHPGTRPDDMSASEHRDHAEHERSTAEAHDARYDPNAREPRGTATHSSELGFPEYGDREYNPTAVHLGHADSHREHAALHSAAAKALESFEDAECKAFRPAIRVVCPLLSVVTSVEDLPNGVRIALADGVSAGAVADHIRCHHAFGRARGFQQMDECPSYVPGLEVGVSPDGKSVVLSSTKPAEGAEIRARAHAHEKP